MRILKAPLFHFLIIGAVIYAVWAAFGQREEHDPAKTVVVTTGEIAWLETSWEKRWNRSPTPAERDGIIDQYVRETILYREALAMGLDKDDTIVRRRMAQKLEFLTQDLAALQPITDADMQEYFETHKEEYREPDLYTITHIYFDSDRRGQRTVTDAETALAQLAAVDHATANLDNIGDPFMLQRYYPERSQLELAKLFGAEFAASVIELPTGTWQGPVQSGYGWHLVYVHQRMPAPPADFDVVTDKVKIDIEDQRREAINDRYYTELRKRYEVVIQDGPAESSPGQP